jgi:hypothetical protein
MIRYSSFGIGNRSVTSFWAHRKKTVQLLEALSEVFAKQNHCIHECKMRRNWFNWNFYCIHVIVDLTVAAHIARLFAEWDAKID